MAIIEHFRKIKVLYIVIACGILASIPSVYFFTKYREAQQRLTNPQYAVAAEVKDIVARVSKLMVLPADEEPTLASITDKDKLRSQPFFMNAVNGDKVLLYMKAKKAILYRPSENKIIEVSPMTITSNATASGELTPTGQPTASRFILWNGTTKIGVATRYEVELKNKFPKATVVDVDNAKLKDYTQSFLISLTKAKEQEALTIAQTLGLPVKPMPSGEATPAASADFLIILGTDKK